MTPNREESMVRCIGYARVSTERQANEVATSMAEQQTQIEALAARMGVSIDRWYRDEGASGSSVQGRPAFSQLLAECAAAPQRAVPGLVLVYDDSRWGRFPNPDEAAYWRHHLHTLGWHVRFCVGDDVEDIGFRHILRAIGGAQSSEERAKIRRRARAGRRGSALQGFWTGREPIGYRRRVVYPPGSERTLEPGQQKATSERVKLVVDPEEAALVRWAFQHYASGEQTLQGLARALARRRPDRQWGKTVVQHLLKNPAYAGDVVGGKRRADRSERLSIGHVRPAAEWYICRDAHEAIVSRALFERVQQRLASNKKLGKGVRAHYLLSGLLTCVYCGGHYAGGGTSPAKPRGNGRLIRFYREAGKAPCPGRMGCVSRHIIDDAAVEAIARVVRRPAMAERITAEIDRHLVRGREQQVSPAQLKRERVQLVQQRERLAAAIARGTLSEIEAERTAEGIRERIAAIDAHAHAARFAGRSAAHGVDRDRLVALALDFPRAAERLHGPALRDLALDWLHTATFDKARRQLVLQIRPLPGFLQRSLPAPVLPNKVRLIRRRLSLVPPSYDVAQAVADLERARRRA